MGGPQEGDKLEGSAQAEEIPLMCAADVLQRLQRLQVPEAIGSLAPRI